MAKTAKIRLYVEGSLGVGQGIVLSRDSANYLFNVMRLSVGAQIRVFNGTDGEWLGEVAEAGKRGGKLVCIEQSGPQLAPPDLWLLFAPIKKSRTAFIVEKAAELGAARIMPILTSYTNSERLRQDRLQAHAVEAAEQCGGTYVPKVEEAQKFDAALADWPADRQLLFCDESLTALPVAEALAKADAGKWAIIIGPEGGFSPDEAAKLRGMSVTTSVTLGPRILRADTAAVAAMTAWQSALGDWG